MIDSRASTWTTSGGDVAILRRTGGLTRGVARSAAAVTTYRGVGDCRPSAERRYLSPAVVHCATFRAHLRRCPEGRFLHGTRDGGGIGAELAYAALQPSRSLTRTGLAKMPISRLATLLLHNFEVHRHSEVTAVATCTSSARRPARTAANEEDESSQPGERWRLRTKRPAALRLTRGQRAADSRRVVNQRRQ